MSTGTILYWIFLPIFLFISFIMILLVLVQKGRGGGLSGAFGGAGGNTAFGAKTGDVLTWATSVVFAIFVILAVVLNLVCDRHDVGQQSRPGQQTQQTQHAPAPASPTPGQ